MKDIGKLERRITNLEYYTSLSLLEKQTESLQIQDEYGLDRFKNVRVPEEGAREILLSDVTMTTGGRVRCFSLEHIGLGVYKVRLSKMTVNHGNYITPPTELEETH